MVAPTPQEPTEESAPIIVTALPRAVGAQAFGATEIDGDTLRSVPGGRIEEALARIPGLAQFRRSDSRSANPSAQGVTLRGLGGNASSRALLTLDGVPLADMFFGAIPFAALNAETLAALEVQRGGGAGAFGAGALTGTLAFRSIPLAERAPLSGLAAISTLGEGRAVGGVVAALGAGHVALDVSGERGDGFYTTPAAQRVAATVRARYGATRVGLTAEAPVSEALTLQARVAGFDDARTLRFAGADSGVSGLDASARVVGGTRWQVDALGWVQVRDFRSVVVSASSFRPTLDQFSTPSSGWGAKLELRAPTPRAATLRFGIDLRGGEGTALENALAPDGSITRRRASGGAQRVLGAFVEAGAEQGALSATIGARVDHWQQSRGFASESLADGRLATRSDLPRRSGEQVSARAAAEWQAAPGVALRGAAYTGFRLPTLNELYRGFTLFPIVTRANPALDLERLSGWQVGVGITPARDVELSVTAFHDRLEGAVGNVTLGPNLRERRNLGAIVSWGVEADARWRSGPWRASAGLAYADPRVDAGTDPLAAPLDGLRPAQTPQVSASARVGWEAGRWSLEAGVRHTGAAFEDDRNIDRLPPATLVDARIAVAVADRVELALALENVFDVAVITRNSGGAVDLGAPRTGWLTIRWGPRRSE